MKRTIKNTLHIATIFLGALLLFSCHSVHKKDSEPILRERISMNEGWKFFKYDSVEHADHLIYDVRPEIKDKNDNKVADSKPTEATETVASQKVLKPWILPTGNTFIKDTTQWYARPSGNPGADFPFAQIDFDDNNWKSIKLPHDWAIKGPFYEGWGTEVGGGMGRLPSNGVAWYRKKLDIPSSDADRSIFLDIDGAMSYAMVWLNGHLVGGWPYGYNSWRVDLTPFVKPGETNQLAIRLDNPNHSARWYPGGGIYRNVWLTKTHPVHVSQWGTTLQTNHISKKSAEVVLGVKIDNDSKNEANIKVITHVYVLENETMLPGEIVESFPTSILALKPLSSNSIQTKVLIQNPHLWGPHPTQKPHQYVAITTLLLDGEPIDQYQTRFGIRSLEFNPDKGLYVNGEHIRIQGVNQHHDLGALGAAFNNRAAERQLEILREMGCNAIRMSHNPPAPELLELTDKMGFLVVNEIFDSWERKKTPHDFHLIFPDWYEQDTRAFIRRDKNSPSVIMWSFGNEVGEQYTGEDGAKIAQRLYNIVKEEDPTRPTTTAMNFAKPDMELPVVPDIISLNYQGEGIRDAKAYNHLKGIRTSPMYPGFHEKFPDKMIVSSETASTLSTRGTYNFPVSPEKSAPAEDGKGADPKNQSVSSFELYTAQFGASPDKVFASQDQHPFVAGEFVWTGWDYLGEPTPYYLARSSYSGIIDLAGFKKDRFYLYQSRWRPDFPMAHILPHWNWPEKIGTITPVHVFTTGDEAELFLNGKSLGRKKKGQYEYRLRWDKVNYQPGTLKVVAYKNGEKWAEESVTTTNQPFQLNAKADRNEIMADGKDLSFITVSVNDEDANIVPMANNRITFSIEGPGEIVATDNGNPSDMVAFPSTSRKAYNGKALVIVRSTKNHSGTIIVTANSSHLKETIIEINSIKDEKSH